MARKDNRRRQEKRQREENAADIRKNWHRGSWVHDHAGWWVYRVPLGWGSHIVDYYWYGKEWWSPTENKEDAPWDREREAASSSQ